MEVMNSKMYDVLRNQFKSNLIQDLLALSAFFPTEDDWRNEVINSCDMVVKKIENEHKKQNDEN